jgi:uncharacterized protein DUF4391
MDDAIQHRVYDSLCLPEEAHIGRRIPKTLLVENGAPTSADKRSIQEGIDELQWLAACKPVTIGVQAFSDETREYLEIAIIACAFREDAKVARLIELIHRAIPYPVVLFTSDKTGFAVSAAHKRRAQNETGHIVIDRIVAATGLRFGADDVAEAAFLESLPLALQPRSNLFSLYAGWIARIEAMSAARLTGSFTASDDGDVIDRRREALDAHASLAKEIENLRSKAKQEKQFSRRVSLNMEIHRREVELAAHKKCL